MSLDAELAQAALTSELEGALYNLLKLVVHGDRWKLYLSDGYCVPEVRAALELLARYHGVKNWRDVI